MTYEAIPLLPVTRDLVRDHDLWTPDTVEYIQSWRVGKNSDGRHAVKHEFRLSYMGETSFFGVIGMEDDPDSQVEDLAGSLAEREMIRIAEKKQAQGSRLKPEDLAKRVNWQVRRDLAAVWRDYIVHARKRSESSNGKVYYAT